MGDTLQLEAYLRRVGYPLSAYTGTFVPPDPTVETLHTLHQCQGQNVPFENLDQHCARHIVLDFDVIYHKIVSRKRGGFCFELNGLYAEMLRRIGFDVAIYAARVMSEGNWTAQKSHVVTVVKIKAPLSTATEGPDDDELNKKQRHDDVGEEMQVWISDVGYASCPHMPLRYDWPGAEQAGDGEWAGFRLTRVKGQVADDHPDEECVMMERRSKADGQWTKAILIYEQPRSLVELTPNCNALQADEETSHLSKRILVSAISESGRKTLSGAYRLITTTFADGKRVERNIMLGEDGQRVARGEREEAKEEGMPTEKEVYLEVLQHEFGLRLTEEEQRALDLEKSKRNASVW